MLWPCVLHGVAPGSLFGVDGHVFNKLESELLVAIETSHFPHMIEEGKLCKRIFSRVTKHLLCMTGALHEGVCADADVD